MRTHPASGKQWSIAADGHEATVVEVGGGVREYTVDGVPALDGYAASEMCPADAGQILAPWPNRIRDGRYSFRGRRHQLPISEPGRSNAIHGLVRWRTWRLVDRSPDAATVECQLYPQPGYPFSMYIATRWSVSADGLQAVHSATCTGSEPAPFGLGAHPYLLVPGSAPNDLLLTVPATHVLQVDERQLPTGTEPIDRGPWDYRSARQIRTAHLDTAFTGLARDRSGRATVRLVTEDEHGLELWMAAAFGWTQIFTGDALPFPRRRRAVAVEPMSCPPDAFNSGTEIVVLEPGDTWTGSWGIRPIR